MGQILEAYTSSAALTRSQNRIDIQPFIAYRKSAMNRPTYELELATLAHAVAHPARVQIIRYLCRFPAGVHAADIAAILPLAQSTVSRHVRVLVDAGLVQMRGNPKRATYLVDPVVVRRLSTLIAGLAASLPGPTWSRR